METSVYPQLVALTGIPLRQTINESDEQFYTAALAAPATHAAIVLAFDGDADRPRCEGAPLRARPPATLQRSRSALSRGLCLRYPGPQG